MEVHGECPIRRSNLISRCVSRNAKDLPPRLCVTVPDCHYVNSITDLAQQSCDPGNAVHASRVPC